MLIRSQNREFLINFNNSILINFNNSIVINIMDVEGAVKIVCSYSCKDYIIGHYSSKAKAIKVLDMIQKAYLNGRIVYQMPADSEVEV